MGRFLEELEWQYGFCSHGYALLKSFGALYPDKFNIAIARYHHIYGTIETRMHNISEEVQGICDSLSELVRKIWSKIVQVQSTRMYHTY